MTSAVLKEKVDSEYAKIKARLDGLASSASIEQKQKVTEAFLVHIEGHKPELVKDFIKYVNTRDAQAAAGYKAVIRNAAKTREKKDYSSFWQAVHDVFSKRFSARDIALLICMDGYLGPSSVWVYSLVHKDPFEPAYLEYIAETWEPP